MSDPPFTHFPWGPPGRRRLVVGLPPETDGAPCRVQLTDDFGATRTTRFLQSRDHKGPRSLLWTGSSVVAGFRHDQIDWSGDGGLTWRRSNWAAPPPPSAEWRGATEGGNVVVLAADNVVAVSFNFGSTFTVIPLAMGKLAGVVHHAGLFHLFTETGGRFFSSTGFSWAGPVNIDIAPTWTFWPPTLEKQHPVGSTMGNLAAVFMDAAGRAGIFLSANGAHWTG